MNRNDRAQYFFRVYLLDYFSLLTGAAHLSPFDYKTLKVLRSSKYSLLTPDRTSEPMVHFVCMNKHLNVAPFQETLNSGYCGPASLKIVLSYYGIYLSEEELAKRTNTNRDIGTTAEDIKRAAEELGFKAEIKNNSTLADIENWLIKDIPVIVDWFTVGRDDYPEDTISADGHYSIVCGIDDTHLYLQDPEIGKVRKITRDTFERVWFDFTGIFIKPDELIVRQLVAIYKD